MGTRYFLLIVLGSMAIAVLRYALRDGATIDWEHDEEQSAIRRGALWFALPSLLVSAILLFYRFNPGRSLGFQIDQFITLGIAAVVLFALVGTPGLWAHSLRSVRQASPATLIFLAVLNMLALVPFALVALFVFGVSRIH